MNEKISRNDLCYCGSGQKFKKCCLQHALKCVDVPDEEWQKLRQIEGTVIDKHLMPYATQGLPYDVMRLALDDCFSQELPEDLDQELLSTHFFIPWFLFNWVPLEEFDIKGFDPDETVSQNYLRIHGDGLNSAERRFIETMNHTYYSFYTVLEVEPEKRLIVKDILLGTTHTIKERQGTYILKRGDIVFSRILTLDNQSIFIGMMPCVIPVHYHHNLLDFKDWLIEKNEVQKLTPDVLRKSSDIILVDYFFDLIKSAFSKPLPTLVNTDGELMQLSKSYFKLTIKPEEALHCLLPLTLSKDAEEFLRDARRSKSGAVQKIEIPWFKKGNKINENGDNTVMGHITLQGNKLILETNSEGRNQRGVKLLDKYLGDAIRFQKTLIESPEQKLKLMLKSPVKNKKIKNEIHLMESPEIQEKLREMTKTHWENWFDQSIPALGDQTPREAAKTERGIERLEALLLEYEQNDARNDDINFLKADIEYLRKELNLDKKSLH